jgi:alkanesulfonate monooxygenase SsuD/methylene tetrahydromethanopterin reductase-like flavin-dependent oxidoreductase (luciferase family)
LILGVRPDRLLSDPEASTNFDDNRSEMFAECINQLLEIWSTEASYRIEGKYWKVFTERAFDARIGEGVMLKPFQRPHPPIVVTAIAPHSSSVFETAKRGWELLSSNFAASWIAKSHWSTFVAGCEAVGRRADPLSWRVAKSIFVADDMKTAKHYATDPSGPYRHYFSTLMTKLIGNGRIGIFKSDPDAPDSSVTVESVIDRMVIYGTPTKVADDILANQEEIGEFGTLLYAGHDWVDRRLAVRSMELMADEVMPLINKSRIVVATTTHADSGETYM